MKVLKTLVSFADEDGSIHKCDTIEYDSKFWLVPHWLEGPTEGTKKPERIVCLAPLRHQRLANTDYADFYLNDPIPRGILYAPIPTTQEAPYFAIARPEIVLTTEDGRR